MQIDNLISIKGGAYNDIKKALRQWIDLYSKDLADGLTFELYKNGIENYSIQADKKLDNERFYFLINYLNYPEGIDYKIDIEGFTIGKEKNQLKGKDLIVYISPTDNEYDNVFVTTSENKCFKIDFGGRITEEKNLKLYQLPLNLNQGISEIILVENKLKIKDEIETEYNKLDRRFKIICVIIVSAFIITLLLFQSHPNFPTINYAIGFTVWGWLTYDYKILQVNKLYFGSLGLGVAILLYGYILSQKVIHEDNFSLILIGTTMPIFFLILQKPLRLIFKKIMKREPKVERPAPSFADGVYITIIWLSSVLIPTLFYTGR